MAGCREYMADAVLGRHPQCSGRGAEITQTSALVADHQGARHQRKLALSYGPQAYEEPRNRLYASWQEAVE